MSDVESQCSTQVGTSNVATYWHHENGAIVVTLNGQARQCEGCPLCNTKAEVGESNAE